MYVLEFELKGLPPLINAQSRAHWAIQYNEAKKWKRWVGQICMGRRPPFPLKRARIECTRCSHGLIGPDMDNLVISFKSTIDALREAKIIENDSPAHVTVKYSWEKAPMKQGKIRVKVTECDTLEKNTSA